MADAVTARDESTQFTPHPEGSYAATCVDVIDMGFRLEAFAGKAPRAVKKVVLVFVTGVLNASGQLAEVAPEFTLSMFETAKLRKFLGTWRGKQYTEEQAREGVPLEKLVGRHAYITVEHKKSKAGRTYALLGGCQPLIPPMVVPTLPVAYARAEFWTERKKSYAEELAVLKATAAQSGKAEPGSFEDFPEALAQEDDDDLPF